MIAYLLVLIGLFLILLEFYLPGAVLGILGGVSVVTGVVLFASSSNSILAALLFTLASIAAIVATVRFALWRIPRTKSIYSNSAQNGYYASSFDKTAIGKQGVVVSDLKPGGHIVIEGKAHQAISVSGYLTKGSSVEVIGGEGESLLVKQRINQ